MNESVKRWKIHPWVLGPLLFFLVLASFQIVLVVMITDHDVSQVEPDAYTRSMQFDSEQEAVARFESAGLQLQVVTPGAAQLEVRLSGVTSSLSDVELNFYRPDSASLDQQVEWADPTQPLALALPRIGLWRLTVTGQLNSEAIRWNEQLNVQ